MPTVILASTSPARGALLRQAGIPFEAVAPRVEEVLVAGRPPLEQARELALAKARAVAAMRPGAIVIGADQIVDAGGRALGKPRSAEEALAQLESLAGRTHEISTAIAVIAPGGEAILDAETTRLAVRALGREELAAYVATGEWEGCAGGYRLEGRGVALFERIEGDPTNVLGLPLPRLLGHLRSLGVPLFGAS